MEIRTLKYFLVSAREGSITKAANSLGFLLYLFFRLLGANQLCRGLYSLNNKWK